MMGQIGAVAVVAGLLLAAFPALRRPAWLAVRGVVGAVLALAAFGVEHRRARQHQLAVGAAATAVPRQQPPVPPVPRRWRVRLTARVDGFAVTLADGEVVGPWRTAAEVRAEALAQWAEIGGWPAGDRRVFAEAWPVPPAARRAA